MSFLIFAMAMLADPIRDPCRDDDMNDRCSPAKQAEMRALYRVPPIESYAGATVRRVFYVDGYGNDTVAIEFIRAPERDPVVRVHFPKGSGGDSTSPLERSLSATDWDKLINASEHFDRVFSSPAQERRKGKSRKDQEEAEEDAIVMCLHSWVYWGEAIDAGKEPRSAVNDACNDSPLEQFAWVAAPIAVAAFPPCDRLDRKYHRNEAKLLSTCTLLSGDRLTAADAFNSLEGFRTIDSASSGIDPHAAWKLTLDWDGAVSNDKAAREYWKAKLSEGGRTFFFLNDVHGLDGKRVRVVGELVHHPKGSEAWTSSTTAPIEMALEREGDSYEIASINVGPFSPLPPPTE